MKHGQDLTGSAGRRAACAIDKSNGDENIEARDGEARQDQGREKKEIQDDVQPKQTRQGKANQGKTR